MNDLPIFLQMFVRLFAAFAFVAWLQTLAPRTVEKPAETEQTCPAKKVVHPVTELPVKPCPVPASASTDSK